MTRPRALQTTYCPLSQAVGRFNRNVIALNRNPTWVINQVFLKRERESLKVCTQCTQCTQTTSIPGAGDRDG